MSREHCAAGSRGLAVASLNLHCGASTGGRPFNVETALRSLDSPLIALQETWSPDGGPDPVASAARALGAQFFPVTLHTAASLSALGIPADSGPGSLGMAVLCKLPVTGYEVADLGQMPGDIIRRFAQIVTIELPDGSVFRVAATHLTHRLISPLQLARLVQHLGGNPLPTVIAGDLNMPRLIAGKAPGYSPAVRGRTFPAELPLVQLDHLLTSHGIHHAGGAVLPPVGSDHLPVRARVGVRADPRARG